MRSLRLIKLRRKKKQIKRKKKRVRGTKKKRIWKSNRNRRLRIGSTSSSRFLKIIRFKNG